MEFVPATCGRKESQGYEKENYLRVEGGCARFGCGGGVIVLPLLHDPLVKEKSSIAIIMPP